MKIKGEQVWQVALYVGSQHSYCSEILKIQLKLCNRYVQTWFALKKKKFFWGIDGNVFFFFFHRTENRIFFDCIKRKFLKNMQVFII